MLGKKKIYFLKKMGLETENLLVWPYYVIQGEGVLVNRKFVV